MRLLAVRCGIATSNPQLGPHHVEHEDHERHCAAGQADALHEARIHNETRRIHESADHDENRLSRLRLRKSRVSHVRDIAGYSVFAAS